VVSKAIQGIVPISLDSSLLSMVTSEQPQPDALDRSGTWFRAAKGCNGIQAEEPSPVQATPDTLDWSLMEDAVTMCQCSQGRFFLLEPRALTAHESVPVLHCRKPESGTIGAEIHFHTLGNQQVDHRERSTQNQPSKH
jgi:hypothetical protein